MNLPNWMYNLPWTIIRDIASDFELDHLIVAAIIMVESTGQQCAMRFEPDWGYHYRVSSFANIAGTTQETERIMQATSFGMMQVMGTVARELGHRGHMSELCDIRKGIEYGCKHLKNKRLTYPNGNDWIAAYNAGSPRKTKGGLYVNEQYVDKVMRYYREFTDYAGDQ